MTLRTNLVLNPSFETGVLGGWGTNGSNPSGNQLDREQSATVGSTTITPQQGAWYAYARRTTAGQLSFFNSTNMPVTAGAIYTGSVYVNRDGTGQIALDIDWYTSGSAYISSTTGTVTPGTGAWARVSSTGAAPSTAAYGRLFIRFLSMAANAFVRVDGAQFEAGSLGDYFDGSTAGCQWNGAAGGSTSSEASGYRRNLVANPSLELSAAGYSIGSVRSGVTASSSVGTSSTATAASGTYYGFLNIASDGAASSYDVVVRGANLKVTPGEQYAFSAAFQNSGTGGFTSWVGVDWLDQTGTQLSSGGSSTGASFTTSNTFTRSPVLTATAPAGAYYARPTLWADSPADTTQRSWRFDALLFEETPTGAYFDGSTTGGSWVGASHNSTSVTDAITVYSGAVTTSSASSASAAALLSPGVVQASTTAPSSTTVTGYAERSGVVSTSSPTTATAAASRTTTGQVSTTAPTSSSTVAATPATASTTAPTVASAAAVVVRPTSTELTVAPTSAVASGEVVPASGAYTTAPSSASASANLTVPGDVTTTSPTTTTASAQATKYTAASTTAASSATAEATHYGLIKATATATTSATATATRNALAAVYTAASSFTSAMAEGPTVTVSYTSASAEAGLLTQAQVVTSSDSSATVDGYADIPVSVSAVAPTTATASVYAIIYVAASTEAETDTYAEARPPAKQAAVTITAPTTATVGATLSLPVAINGVGVLPTTATAAAFVYTPVFQAPAGPVKTQVPRPVMRLLVADTITGRIGWELPYTQIGWSAPLNKAGTMTATLTLDEVLEAVHAQGAANPAKALRETLTGPMRFSYVVTYGNAPVWAGPMKPAVSFGADTNDVSVGGSQLESMFENRVLIGPGTGPLNDVSRDVVFRQTTAAGALYRAALHAIDTTGSRPARALPITCSRPPALVGDEDFVYRSYDLVPAWKAMTDLMDRDDGPDMRLHPYLVETSGGLFVQWDLQIGTPMLPSSATPGDDGPLPWTFTDKTSRIETATDAVGMATTYYSSGDGQDRAKLLTSASSTKLTRLGWPALEKAETGRSSESDPDKLASYTRGLIDAHETPTSVWKVSTPIDGANPLGSYRAGDEAFLDIRAHALIEPGRYRRRITEVSHDGGPFVSISCDTDDNTMAGV